ncbi:Aluminum-activated malate transporter 10 [Morella rubra]|uniref:Aluminum-activated malate transporter 10 n=1 Tax=Morella rubra TaxID=262757 RepID=A0A6A1UTZ5_9ROSI|nr:Aluminum-activated malate transporter 10 [Morella rubra]
MAAKLTNMSEKLESRINMTDRISKALSSESGPVHKGATLSKAINRWTGTFLGGGLAVGIHFAARSIDENLKTLIVGVSIFVFAGAATFFRFIPSVKALFDYGFVIFVLTFSMVSVYGYRIEALYDTAYERIGTVCIGSLVCIVINTLISPIWAGTELHNSIARCVVEFFKSEVNSTKPGNQEDRRKIMQGYKSALNTKATEDSMVSFARWEPAHGEFGFQHPWQQYLKIGPPCATTPEHLKKPVSHACVILSAYCPDVLKELTVTMKTKTKSCKIEFLVGQMKVAVEELQDASKSIPHFLIADALSTIVEAPINDDAKRDPNIPKAPIPLFMEFLPLTTLVSVLIATVTRVERIVDAVDQLSNLANFKLPK